jgi:hypothetical protein
VSVRAVIAVARVKLLELSRSPIALIVVAAFALLLFALPEPGPVPRSDRIRQAAAWAVSAAGALIWLTAMLVPVAGGAPAARAREGRVIGARAADFGHAAAALVFLVFVAGALGLASWIWLSSKHGDPDGRAGAAVVRQVVHENDSAFRLRPGDEWRSEPVVLARHAGTVEVELLPRVRFAAEAAPDTGPAAASLEVSWRSQGGRVRTRRVALGARRPIVAPLEIGDPDGRPATIGLKLSGRAVEAEFERGAVVALGTRTALFPALVRSLLVVACLAFVLAGVTQWFSGFVGPVIAVSAALTLGLAVAVFRATDFGWLAAAGRVFPADPVAALRLGRETAWPEVLRAFAVAGATLAAVAAAAVRGPARAPA